MMSDVFSNSVKGLSAIKLIKCAKHAMWRFLPNNLFTAAVMLAALSVIIATILSVSISQFSKQLLICSTM